VVRFVGVKNVAEARLGSTIKYRHYERMPSFCYAWWAVLYHNGIKSLPGDLLKLPEERISRHVTAHPYSFQFVEVYCMCKAVPASLVSVGGHYGMSVSGYNGRKAQHRAIRPEAGRCLRDAGESKQSRANNSHI
jgi:hypothetical protein